MYCMGAGSEELASTTMLYLIASCSSKVLMTCAMVERFWPMAT